MVALFICLFEKDVNRICYILHSLDYTDVLCILQEVNITALTSIYIIIDLYCHVLDLKRFSGLRYRTKLETMVNFPHELNLREFSANQHCKSFEECFRVVYYIILQYVILHCIIFWYYSLFPTHIVVSLKQA